MDVCITLCVCIWFPLKYRSWYLSLSSHGRKSHFCWPWHAKIHQIHALLSTHNMHLASFQALQTKCIHSILFITVFYSILCILYSILSQMWIPRGFISVFYYVKPLQSVYSLLLQFTIWFFLLYLSHPYLHHILHIATNATYIFIA